MRNVNVGVLGHVDSGKTSVVEALSSRLSTAALDKHPSSKERGITIDLGFSCIDYETSDGSTKMVTLVDCPGHASLLRTIICGARIIDLILLVIDVTKGVQTQTAECIVLAEILSRTTAIVVLNKVDLVSANDADTMEKRVRKTLKTTSLEVVAVLRTAAKPKKEFTDTGIDSLREAILQQRERTLLRYNDIKPEVQPLNDTKTVVAIDHHFQIKGKGTILTGTILKGALQVNSELELPIVGKGFTRKVRSIQSFHKSVERATRGDRIGIAVDTTKDLQTERFYAVSPPGLSVYAKAVLGNIASVTYYSGTIKSQERFHLHIGHDVVPVQVHLYSLAEQELDGGQITDFKAREFMSEIDLSDCDKNRKYFAVFEFETAARALCDIADAIAIGSKLDQDIKLKRCRIAFRSEIVCALDDEWRKTFVAYRWKSKEGTVDRVVNEKEFICRALFNKDSNIEQFIGMRVRVYNSKCENDESVSFTAKIAGKFGGSGKVRLLLEDKTHSKLCDRHVGWTVLLTYKKYHEAIKGVKKFSQSWPID
mmetsp:Transcript_6650/g.20134  ORF Transcript_6650/g.20134 Transcript_6650/m.20134 type:complete len:539 (+) Transcript_6650:91-1707(+)